MWAAILLYAVARIAGRGSFPVMNYLRAATLFPVGPVDPSSIWTLRHEALFYILFAACLPNFRRLWPIVAAWCLSPIIYALVGASEPYADFAFNNVDMLFGLGAVLGCLYLRTITRWPVSRWAPWALLILVPPLALGDRTADGGVAGRVRALAGARSHGAALCLRLGRRRLAAGPAWRTMPNACWC